MWTCTDGSTGEMTSILAVAQGGGAGESMQRESFVGESSGVRLGMKFFSVPQETKVLGGYCGEQKSTQGAAGDYLGKRWERGVKVHRSLHTLCCRVHFDFHKQLW